MSGKRFAIYEKKNAIANMDLEGVLVYLLMRIRLFA